MPIWHGHVVLSAAILWLGYDFYFQITHKPPSMRQHYVCWQKCKKPLHPLITTRRTFALFLCAYTFPITQGACQNRYVASAMLMMSFSVYTWSLSRLLNTRYDIYDIPNFEKRRNIVMYLEAMDNVKRFAVAKGRAQQLPVPPDVYSESCPKIEYLPIHNRHIYTILEAAKHNLFIQEHLPCPLCEIVHNYLSNDPGITDPIKLL